MGLTNWTVSATGYIYPVSTNALQGGAGSGHVFAHSGTNVFQLFDTTANSAILYQDFPAAVGSQWAASCYAICYASNYFNPGANAHMQVVFYDATNNVLASTNSGSGNGVYGSDFLDPSGSPDTNSIYWIFAPPPALTTNDWVFLQPTNLYTTDPAQEYSHEPPLTPITTNLMVAPPGTAFVRYQLEFDNTSTDGGAVYFDDCVLNKLVGTDPDIAVNPVAVTVLAGLPATFTVTAIKSNKQEVLTYQWQQNGTNLPPAGGINGIAGTATNATLFFTNCQDVSAGLYSVVVSDTNGSIRSVPVLLTVNHLSPIQRVNLLGANAGFENNPTWLPWNYFNGAAFQTADNYYAGSTSNVNVYAGSSVALSGMNGDRDNGFWMSVPATPGAFYKAGGYAYISSVNDFFGGNTCRLQIWFKSAAGDSLSPPDPTYESFKMYGLDYTNADMEYTNIDVSSPNYGKLGYHDQLPRDQWVYLTVSNAVNNNGIGLQDDLPTNTLSSGVFQMPANASQINCQVYEYCPVAADPPTGGYAGVAIDAVYWDEMRLIQVVPVTDLRASVAGGNINLSFSAGAGLDYSVLYKTNLTDATWSVLTNNVTAPDSWATNPASIGITYPMTISDRLGASRRFYRMEVY